MVRRDCDDFWDFFHPLAMGFIVGFAFGAATVQVVLSWGSK